MWEDKPNIQVIILIVVFTLLVLAITEFFWAKAHLARKQADQTGKVSFTKAELLAKDDEIISLLEEINRKLSNIQTNEVA
jgi:sensor histidine kinase regulating citrate/malate metabolism